MPYNDKIHINYEIQQQQQKKPYKFEDRCKDPFVFLLGWIGTFEAQR